MSERASRPERAPVVGRDQARGAGQPVSIAADEALHRHVRRIRDCRICREAPRGTPLPQEPRPILRVTRSARLAVFSQAPGIRAHTADLPFMDPSGVRLRDWLGMGEELFYDADFLAIAPMGFCFPGHDAKGGDRPPRQECAPAWRAELMAHLQGLELALLVGRYAQTWHLGPLARPTVTETVRDWRDILETTRADGLAYLPLPHPSWRNNAWIKANPWFESELLPELKARVAELRSAYSAMRG